MQFNVSPMNSLMSVRGPLIISMSISVECRWVLKCLDLKSLKSCGNSKRETVDTPRA